MRVSPSFSQPYRILPAGTDCPAFGSRTAAVHIRTAPIALIGKRAKSFLTGKKIENYLEVESAVMICLIQVTERQTADYVESCKGSYGIMERRFWLVRRLNDNRY